MKKILSLLVVLLTAVTSAWADAVTLNFKDGTLSDEDKTLTITDASSGITVTMTADMIFFEEDVVNFMGLSCSMTVSGGTVSKISLKCNTGSQEITGAGPYSFNLEAGNLIYDAKRLDQVTGITVTYQPSSVPFKIDFRVQASDDQTYTVVTPASGVLPSKISDFNAGTPASTYSQHGTQNASFKVAVYGPVKFMIGGCQYTNGATVSVNDDPAIAIDTKAPGCENVVSSIETATYDKYATYLYDKDEAATLTFNLGDYCPYIIALPYKIVSTETELNNAITSAQTGEIIRLAADIDLTSARIEVASDKDFTLDLNGHTIDGQQKYQVICNKGTLTIKNGTITGGYATSSNGAGIYNYETLVLDGVKVTENNASASGGAIYTIGSLTLKGGTEITNNTAGRYGGAISTASGATVNLFGCTITGNKAQYCGGVEVFQNTTNSIAYNIGGKVVIKDNYLSDGTTKSDLGIYQNGVLTISTETPLVEGSEIGVFAFTGRSNSPETAKFTTNGSATDVQYFFSDNADYIVKYKENVLCTTEPANTVIVSGEKVSAFTGIEKTVKVKFDSDYAISALQANVTLPDGVVLVDGSFAMGSLLNATDFEATMQKVEGSDGKYTILVKAKDGVQKAFTPIADTVLVTFKVKASEAMEEGKILFSNIKSSTTTAVQYTQADFVAPLDVIELKRGDADVNGTYTVNDYNLVKNYILTATELPEAETQARYQADANGDNTIDASDLTVIVDKTYEAAADKSKFNVGSVMCNVEGLSLAADGNQLVISADNANGFIAAQMDITLPEGVHVTSAKSAGHIVSFNQLANGKTRVLVAGFNNSTFSEDVATITLSSEAQSASASNVIFTNTARQSVKAVAPATVTGIADAQSVKCNVESVKVLDNGKVVIKKNGKTYNVKGQLVK